jgi:hypothetical protein
LLTAARLNPMRRLRLAAAIFAAFATALFAAPAEAKPTFALSSATAKVGSDAVFNLTRTYGSQGVYVRFDTSDGTAHAGVDYIAAHQTVYVKPGLGYAFHVRTLAAPNATGTRAFKLAFTAYNAATATGSIVEPPPPPPPALTVQSITVPEDGGDATVHVLRTGSLLQASSYAYSTQGVTAVAGLNFTAVSGGLTFAPGQTDSSFKVPVLRDFKVNPTLVLNIVLSSFQNAVLGLNGTLSITNVDVPPPATQTCPDGSVIPATSVCPPPLPPPPPAGALGHATATAACPALNRPENIVLGQTYAVSGFAGYNPQGDATPPPAGTQDVVVLSDAAHPGDGYASLWVDRACLTLAP